MDISILERDFNVEVIVLSWNKISNFFKNAVLIYKATRRERKQLHAIVVSAGSYHSYYASVVGKWFRIPLFIILHGSDSFSMPSLNYGSLRKPWLKFLIGISLKRAKKLFPVSESLIQSELTYNSLPSESHQGIKHYFPSLKTEYRVIYNALEPKFWSMDETISRDKNAYITVFNPSQYYLKGGDIILEAAKKHPEKTFYVAGCDPLENIEIPENVLFLGHLSQEELRNHFRKCKFYLQLSIFEGFGCSLVEAILSGCIPIGSNVNLIPFIIDNADLILTKRNSEQFSNLLKSIDEKNDEDLKTYVEANRIRLTEQFSIARRQEAFKQELL